MAESNSTAAGYPRSSRSAELMVPYVMIGVSCVTFLAVHFWCYHKRNRERYLRKRDEKRVKSGLLERRRIATLMLARYQSDLGISQNGVEVEMSDNVLYYDNAADIIYDETEENNRSLAKKDSGMHQPGEPENKTEDTPSATLSTNTTADSAITNLLAATASTSVFESALSNSQTWPMASERRPTNYNAHSGINRTSAPENENNRYENKDTVPTDPNSNKDSARSARNVPEQPTGQKSNKESTRSARNVPEQPTGQNSLVYKPEEPDSIRAHKLSNTAKETSSQFRSEPRHNPSASEFHVLKSASPASNYPNVYYTHLSPPYSSQTAPFTPFRPKQKKRRHDGAPVDDGDKAHTLYHNYKDHSSIQEPGELSRLYDYDRESSSNPYTITGTNKNNMGYIYGDGDYSFYSPRTNNQSHYGFAEDEAFPFAEMGHAYGSISSNMVNRNIQVIPLREIQHCLTGCDIRSTQHQNPSPQASYYDQRRAVYILQDEGSHRRNASSTDIVLEDRGGSNPAHSHHSTLSRQHSYHSYSPQHIVIPLPDRSPQNFLSTSPGKVLGSAAVNMFSNTSRVPKAKQAPLTKMDTFDNCNSDLGNGTQSREAASHGQCRVTERHELKKEIPQNSRGNSGLHGNMVNKLQHKSDIDQSLPTENRCPSTPGHTSLQAPKTPTLRTLDPQLVFQHTKRKLDVKSD